MDAIKRSIFLIVLVCLSLNSFAFIVSENDIKNIAKALMQKGGGQYDCYADQRTLVFEVYLYDSAYLEHFEKSKILSNIEEELATLCATNFIDVKYVIHYTNRYGNEAVMNVRINSSDFLCLSGNSKIIYSTKDSPKGLGVNMTISKPKGWEAVDGDGPHIVQKFEVKQNGNYTCYLIQMNAMPTFISKKEATDIMSGNSEYGIEWNNYIGNIFPASAENSKIISVSDDIVGTYPAKRIEYSYKVAKIGVTMSIYGVSWMIFFEDVLISLNGCTTTDNKNEFNAFCALFSLITNSVHFYDIYNDRDYAK